jgi:large subunit ribosomal protein L24|tara:strand:+ start:140 stop:460 length:321 start_codon:yes stop_codon:yes gene_type:complete
MAKLKLKLGDSVKVMTGKSRGHVGRIISMMIDKNRALVEGANMVSRHTKPNAKNKEGGILKKESPINLSNLMLVDSKGNPSKVGVKIDKKTGNKNRYFKKTGELIK